MEKRWPAGDSEQARHIRERDWAATPLGPIRGWPQRLKGLVDLILVSRQPMFVAAGPDLRVIYNDAYAVFLPGMHPQALGAPFRDLFAEISETLEPMLQRTLAGQQEIMHDRHFIMPWRTEAPEGWFTASWTPMLDDDGCVAGFVAAITETTETVQMQRHADESEERLRLSLGASGMGTFIWYVDEDRGEPDAKMRELFGLPPDGELNLAIALGDLIHPEDRAHYAEAVARATDPDGDGQLRDEIRIRRPSDGEERWIAITGQTEFRGRNRRAVRIPGVAQDITDNRVASQRQRLLLAELQHRVRNILATVRSMVRRTMQASTSVDDLSMHLEGRINALARTQVILSRNPGAGVDLETILREELLAQAGSDGQITIEGPQVDLSPKAAEVITLALHELTTNSIKYGALHDHAGRIAIVWRLQEKAGETWLRIAWVESKVKIIASAPRREGFGQELITSRVPYELAGTGSLELKPGGVHATIEFPLRPGGSILETTGGK